MGYRQIVAHCWILVETRNEQRVTKKFQISLVSFKLRFLRTLLVFINP
jgi:hypothetical protein